MLFHHPATGTGSSERCSRGPGCKIQHCDAASRLASISAKPGTPSPRLYFSIGWAKSATVHSRINNIAPAVLITWWSPPSRSTWNAPSLSLGNPRPSIRPCSNTSRRSAGEQVGLTGSYLWHSYKASGQRRLPHAPASRIKARQSLAYVNLPSWGGPFFVTIPVPLLSGNPSASRTTACPWRFSQTQGPRHDD